MNAQAKDVAYNNLHGKDKINADYWNTSQYSEDASRTASDAFHSDLVPVEVLLDAIEGIKLVNDKIDIIKKALFYGKQNDELAFTVQFIENTAGYGDIDPYIVHGILGKYTEAYELMELLEEALKNKTNPTRGKVIDESGDDLWYTAMLLDAEGTTFEEVATKNIEKLKIRYPDKFSLENSNKRNIENEYKPFTED